MDEAEWLACDEPAEMLELLRDRGQLSERKARLFAVLCCRRVWDALYDIEQRAAAVAERYLEGLAGETERAAAFEEIRRTAMSVYGQDGSPVALDLLDREGRFAAEAVLLLLPEPPSAALLEKRIWCSLLREIVGNPYRPITLDLAWRTTAVLALAQAAYEERRLPTGTLDADQLAILADALEEAGCTAAAILNHCRANSVHVRGCWVVDLLLDKK